MTYVFGYTASLAQAFHDLINVSADMDPSDLVAGETSLTNLLIDPLCFPRVIVTCHEELLS